MYVSVFYHDEAAGGYKVGRAYAYSTPLALQPGDKVIAPTVKNPEQRAIVAEIDIPEPPFECRVIGRYDDGGETAEVTSV